ncbi:PepSY-associated TM helix domain-containing protein [Novosphingobium sp. Leaf2]|uniref:PepSY-associated TM helix domain-containing protein n=1 Tax=Novosphingobium sp. Leaf2 TaxID=1735670 RepID=UPI0006F750E8|nr:PepSY-associated TM helix domain-containing protein [Novosphingobium sp. Leaf2]KQM13833.1 peptidase [Novosphingobium sp. Leaf2]
MTNAPEPSTIKRALTSHAAIGLLVGALLYVVCLTGTIVVFFAELQRFEQPHVPEMRTISPDAVQRGVEAVLARESAKPASGHMYVHLPVEDLPRATITTDSGAVHLQPDGRLANDEQVAWSDFLVALHYTLNIPGVIGITLVGALGVMILALSLSGVIAHPRIFRDAFRLRARDTGGLALADWHNRLSVWSLPFSVAVALTGAVIGLASLTAYVMAARDHKGDLEAVYAPIFGAEGKPDKRKAAAPNVGAALAYMAAHYPATTVTYVIVHEPATVGQEIQITAEHPRRLIYGENYRFDAQGQFRGTVGLSDGAVGQQIASSNYRLHFGTFAGLPVKLAYLVFGFALSAICATGTYIWLGKRRRRGHHEPRLLKAWDAVVWGAPLALTLTLLGRFAIGNAAPFALIFWVGQAVLIAAACAPFDPARFRKVLQVGLAVCLVLAVVVGAAR